MICGEPPVTVTLKPTQQENDQPDPTVFAQTAKRPNRASPQVTTDLLSPHTAAKAAREAHSC